MTDAAEPGEQPPGQDRDPLESDLDQARAAHGRLGKVWAVTAVGAWSAMAVIALTVGRPELAKVQHIVQQTTGMSALPPLIPGFPPASAPPSSTPPSHGLSNVPTVQNGAVSRRGGGVTRGAAGAAGGSGPSAPPSATQSPSLPAGYTQPPASDSATATPPATVPAPPPTTAPPTATTTPTPTPTPDPTADPTATPTADPTATTTSPAAASCLSSAASSSSVTSLLGAVTSCTSELPVP